MFSVSPVIISAASNNPWAKLAWEQRITPIIFTFSF
jgi:hypothetical protein